MAEKGETIMRKFEKKILFRTIFRPCHINEKFSEAVNRKAFRNYTL